MSDIETTPSTTATNANPPFELDIVINNVVCSFSVRCHLKLREIALHGSNVEYRRENGMVTMRLRRPYTTASIWSSGRITCTGAISEAQAKVAARRYARSLAKLGFPVRFQHFRIVNVLGTCSMPWPIRIVNFSERHRESACYEPELHPGVTFKMQEPKATLKIFSTGSITVTAASVSAVETAVQRLYPLVHEFRTRPLNEILDDGKMKPKLPNLLKRPMPSHAMAGNAISKLMPTPVDMSMPMPLSLPVAPPMRIPMLNVMPGLKREQPTPPPKSAPSENICGNARRRAAECWASKLQKKRPRFNDAGAMAILNANNLARQNQLLRKAPNKPDVKSTALGGELESSATDDEKKHS
ncbi:TATA box-binding protein-like protein 1 [Drosophila navojoa]|uniref:TATA box-binding protein-like protein 1 n=1 Tax=Drosophila navojoa TaxID=7232 RepID=UPI0011BDB866|nr:TATA box-binding protein-like protein 1 [Drosophila navojoa]